MRTVMIAGAFLALAPCAAAMQLGSQSAAAVSEAAPSVGLPVLADDGSVQGHVESVGRDQRGVIVSAAIDESMEPADAPAAALAPTPKGKADRITQEPAGAFAIAWK